MHIDTAIIPAAGRGTRMKPYTRYYPKEMMPLGDTPALFYLCEELAGAGISRIIMVVSPDKTGFKDILTGKYPEVSFEFITQNSPTGLGDALVLADDALSAYPVHLALPDNIAFSDKQNVTQLLEHAWNSTGQSVRALISIDDHRSAKGYSDSGTGTFWKVRDDLYQILSLKKKSREKTLADYSLPVLTAIGRSVLTDGFFQAAKEVRKHMEHTAESGEFDDREIFQHLIDHTDLFGYLLPVPVYDIGNRLGYLLAQKALLADVM